MSGSSLSWLAADYHLPATYSCRLPLSSANSALISPVPGPAMVRLALIRVGIELFGRAVVRDSLFPWLRAARVLIRPPERVAFCGQVLRAYKADEDKGRVAVGESVVYREMAHAEGSMTVFLDIPLEERSVWESLLKGIGYWGQTSSFAVCLEVRERAPETRECAQPLQAIGEHVLIQPFFSCILSEFRDSHVLWQEVVPEETPEKTTRNPLKLEMYVWPLQVTRRAGGSTLLVRSPFA
jgi:hypothetical protein